MEIKAVVQVQEAIVLVIAVAIAVYCTNMNGLDAQKRRKEQNRRAQASLRRKRQEQIQGFEQQIEDMNQEIIWLRSFADIYQANQPLPMWDTNHLPAPPTDLVWPISFSNPISFNFDDVNIQGDAAVPLTERDTVDGSYMTRFPSSASTSSQPMDMTRMIPSGLPTTVNTQNNCPASWQASSTTLPSCSFDCLARNAATLGISPEGFLSTHSASPFYQPFSTREFLLAAIQGLPSSLRPSVAQLSYAHQAWVDCIPEPDLRSRIIFATCHKPPLLDCLDLWHDVLAGGDPCPQDKNNVPNWKLSTEFLDRWQMLLKMDLQNLQMMCTASNPPLLLINLSEE